ncbi:MAG TPA: DUF1592 domain-containing protein [Oligoflexus sp.]|uniref:DUF1592 domain-containing protein n=1 Tax=Oligoflexus sp. TaxID=1971216 RepID=UPI002D5BF6BB|nr:DUF1592 domain-containing protein [Oligoflexus sp.]HYX34017.1 DUF1592 domain-containing protein [Oligoflexus sp.]
MRGQRRRIPAISLAIFALLTACLEQQSPKADKSLPEEALAEPETPRLAEITLNPAAIRRTLEQIFAKDSTCSNQPAVSSRRQLRLLTRDEYNRSIKDIFRLYADYRGSIPIEQKVLGFSNNSQFALVSSDHAAAYDKTAKELAQQIVAAEWSRLVKCQVSEGASCAEKFVRTYAPRTWRRPVTEDEVQALLRVHKVGSDISPTTGMELVVRGLISSPHFLYRSETGRDGKLTAYEVASALSYFFWGTTPDDELLKLAGDGTLLNEETLLTQARRLLQSDRAKEGMKAFADAWLNYSAVLSVNKDASRYPAFDYNVRTGMARETEDFFDYLVRKKQAGFTELFTADYSFGDQRLADFYRAQLTPEGDLQKLTFAGQPRLGLMGHGSLLSSLAYATETGPIQRGKFVREHLLCDMLTPPPPELMIMVPPPKEGATTRERFAAHTSAAACRGCHIKIDGVGFSMEDFDAVGLYRTVDSGKPVDASGQVHALDGKNVDINGAKELGLALATSTRAKQCFVVQTWRMAQGRLESTDDVCSLRQISSAFVEQNMSMAQLLIKLITDPSYIQRSH